jgi:hypothetical protein
MRDHGDNKKKRYQKMYAIKCLIFITNFMEIVKSFRTKSFPQETSKIKKKILKTAKTKKKKSFTSNFHK